MKDGRTTWNQAFSEKIIAVIEPNYELNLINIDIAECYGGIREWVQRMMEEGQMWHHGLHIHLEPDIYSIENVSFVGGG